MHQFIDGRRVGARTPGNGSAFQVIDPATGKVEAVSGHGADCVFRHS